MKQKQISEFEQQVMNIVWNRKKCSGKEVYDELSKEKKVAYNTLATILDRLHEKGLVNKRIEKGVNLFSPKVTKESYSKNLVNSFLKKFVATFGEMGIASFAQSVDTLPKGKRDYFLSLLEKHDNKDK